MKVSYVNHNSLYSMYMAVCKQVGVATLLFLSPARKIEYYAMLHMNVTESWRKTKTHIKQIPSRRRSLLYN